MSDQLTRFPLCWPDGWQRASTRTSDKFGARARGLSVIDGVGRVLDELQRIGVQENDVVISTNVRTRLDGLPRSDQANPLDPGAAVYWEARDRAGSFKKRQCMAIDRHTRVSGNLAAIAATLEAMRAIERHGGAEILDRAFTGFIALPAPEQWFQVLEVSASATPEEIRQAHRRMASYLHSDRGGEDAQMARINVARDEGLRART